MIKQTQKSATKTALKNASKLCLVLCAVLLLVLVTCRTAVLSAYAAPAASTAYAETSAYSESSAYSETDTYNETSADTYGDTDAYGDTTEAAPEDTTDDSSMPGWKTLLVCLAIGVIIGFSVVHSMRGQLKTVQHEQTADYYVSQDLNLRKNRDEFLYREEQKVRRSSGNKRF